MSSLWLAVLGMGYMVFEAVQKGLALQAASYRFLSSAQAFARNDIGDWIGMKCMVKPFQ